MAIPRRRTLLVEMALEQAQANYVRKVLGDSAKAIEEQLGKIGTSGNPLTRMQLEAQRSSIKAMLNQDFSNIEESIKAGKIDAAKAASQIVSGYENTLLKAVADKKAMARIARSEAQRTVNNLEAAIKRMQGTSYNTLSKQVYKTKQLSAGWVDDIINRGLVSGWSAKQLSDAIIPSISPNVRGGVSYAANRLARTEINNAYHAASWDRYMKSAIVDEVEWLLSSSHPEDDICNDYAAESPFKKNAVPAKPHPNCVIEGTLVQFPEGRPVAATARWHEGEIVEIGTAGGGRLAVTPNHPILTSRGWVAAGALQIGDRVIRGSFLQEIGSGANPDEEHVISKAEDVFRTMRDSGSLATSSIVRGMAEDFHGDGVVDQEVHVVTANVLLQKHLASFSFADPVAQFALDILDTDTPFESGLSSLDERVLSDDATTSSFMSTLRPETVLLRSSLSMDERDSLLMAAERNPVAAQPALQGYSIAGEFEALDDLIRGETGIVELDDVIGVARREWSGHVYNFQTETGTYISNSILSHNCYCYIAPRLPTEEEFLDRLFAGEYGDEPWVGEISPVRAAGSIVKQTAGKYASAAAKAPKLESIMDLDDPEDMVAAFGKVFEGQKYNGFNVVVDTAGYAEDGIGVQMRIMKDGREAGFATRIFRDDGTVYHDMLKLGQEFRGQGFGTAFSDFSESYYQANGVVAVRLHAALENGGYTWAKAGYMWDETVEDAAGGVYSRMEYLSGLDDNWSRLGFEDPNSPFLRLYNAIEEGEDVFDWPTPAELANYKYNGVDVGKEILSGSHWHGVKLLEEVG